MADNPWQALVRAAVKSAALDDSAKLHVTASHGPMQSPNDPTAKDIGQFDVQPDLTTPRIRPPFDPRYVRVAVDTEQDPKMVAYTLQHELQHAKDYLDTLDKYGLSGVDPRYGVIKPSIKPNHFLGGSSEEVGDRFPNLYQNLNAQP